MSDERKLLIDTLSGAPCSHEYLEDRLDEEEVGDLADFLLAEGYRSGEVLWGVEIIATGAVTAARSREDAERIAAQRPAAWRAVSRVESPWSVSE